MKVSELIVLLTQYLAAGDADVVIEGGEADTLLGHALLRPTGELDPVTAHQRGFRGAKTAVMIRRGDDV